MVQVYCTIIAIWYQIDEDLNYYFSQQNRKENIQFYDYFPTFLSFSTRLKTKVLKYKL